jgi:hypothetical protein
MVSVSRGGVGAFHFQTASSPVSRVTAVAPFRRLPSLPVTSYRYTCTATGIAGDLPVSVPVGEKTGSRDSTGNR